MRAPPGCRSGEGAIEALTLRVRPGSPSAMTTKKSNDPASGAAPRESAGILEHFDSLGDNCEFAFAQKRFGVDKSSLLRWAVTPFSALLSGLENRFEGLYQFERLTCTSDG